MPESTIHEENLPNTKQKNVVLKHHLIPTGTARRTDRTTEPQTDMSIDNKGRYKACKPIK